MTLNELNSMFFPNFFWDYQVKRIFPEEKEEHINIQLSRMVKSGRLIRLKRGLFCFPETLKNHRNEFVLAQLLYEPSYISLESALNAQGVIPDIPQNVTSISPTTTKKVTVSIGTFLYSKIQTSLYFGYEKINDGNSPYYYNMALPEKAFLDYLYIRKIKDLKDLRIDFKSLNSSVIKKYSSHYPKWVQVLANE